MRSSISSIASAMVGSSAVRVCAREDHLRSLARGSGAGTRAAPRAVVAEDTRAVLDGRACAASRRVGHVLQ